MNRLEQLKSFLEREPNDPFLNYAMATELIASGQDEDAKVIFLKLLEESPEYSATYYHLGKLYEREGEAQLAEETYRAGIAITTKNREEHARRELQNALNELLFDD